MDMTTQHTESAEDSVTFKEESLSQRGFSFFFFIFISLHIHFYMLIRLRNCAAATTPTAAVRKQFSERD